MNRSIAAAAVAIALGVIVALLTSDVILGVIAGGGAISILTTIPRFHRLLWAGDEQHPIRH